TGHSLTYTSVQKHCCIKVFVIFNLLDFPQAFALFQIICPFFAPKKHKNNHTPKLIGGVVLLIVKE
ncbi:hypothetical protein, partial [Staphylococcus aureus]|uniref:hypothetical protein n=1 Tax=Staphylococcus aureus TaxID=1280 RepID=UPI001C9D17A3